MPSPLALAILLSIVVGGLALIFGNFSTENRISELYTYWTSGLWNNGLLVFAVQMMLMLVLGHVIALSKPFEKLIHFFVQHGKNTSSAAALVALSTVAVGFFNWGLGLIFGAILSRKMGEHAIRNHIPINYPLVGAAGYTALMVFHGGFSGSSLAKVAEEGHLQSLGGANAWATSLPKVLSFSETVFSPMNITVSLALLLLVPLFFFFMGKRVPTHPFQLKTKVVENKLMRVEGAERLDHSKFFGLCLGLLILVGIFYTMFTQTGFFGFFNPNNINLLLLSLALIAHARLSNFGNAVSDAMSSAAGILIQFPLYFGVMGIMKEAGLASQLSYFFVSISNELTFPLFTFLSAGIINIFVPSGGGQWAIQGPIIVEASSTLNVPLAKSILAMAYGDQLTNMLQPFWALPLLGITELKAKEILPYTLLLMLLGVVIFVSALLLF